MADTRLLALFLSTGAGILVASKLWLYQITKHVPEPYLDEVFHIPQAQAYCRGDYQVWDDKITTPPGLYAFSTTILKFSRSVACSAYDLRQTNIVALLVLFSFAVTARRLIESLPLNPISKTSDRSWTFKSIPISSYALHTGCNIALFPPIFFFSGLYYTDILSTAVVLMTYSFFLRRNGAYNNSASGGVQIVVHGLLALTMRQTNIFWVAVFLAGLEVVRAVKSLGPFPASTWKGDLHPYKHFQLQFVAYGRGEIHDIPASDATLNDYALCAMSVALAAICNPVLVITRLWPYITLLCSFAGFVYWNGGVVLGDKSNHMATIHLPQMLYIWPFFVFFSAPLLYPFVLHLLGSVFNILKSKDDLPKPSKDDPQAIRKQQLQKASANPSYTVTFLSFAAFLGLSLAIIHYNTIIHPFTLADNRHYIFYIFRYSIRAHPLIRYLLAPIYVACGWLVFRGISSAAKPPSFNLPELPEGTKVTFVNKSPPQAVDENTTSFGLIWFVSTALSLITAPLVEPRYFIIPWVIWRLHVSPATLKQHDYRLWLETAWFVVINAVTGYIFLFRGFEWPQEPGKVQRFMW